MEYALDSVFGYLATAAVSGTGGYWVALVKARPLTAELAMRVDVAERGLYNQGQAIRELAEALRGLLAEIDRDAEAPSSRNAIVHAQHVLMKI